MVRSGIPSRRRLERHGLREYTITGPAKCLYQAGGWRPYSGNAPDQGICCYYWRTIARKLRSDMAIQIKPPKFVVLRRSYQESLAIVMIYAHIMKVMYMEDQNQPDKNTSYYYMQPGLLEVALASAAS